MKDIGAILLSIFTGIVIIAIVSVILSNKSGTPSIIQAISSALGNVIGAAVNPSSLRSANTNIGNQASGLGNPSATASTNGNLGLNTLTDMSSLGQQWFQGNLGQ